MSIYKKVLDDLICWLWILSGYIIAGFARGQKDIFSTNFFALAIVSAAIVLSIRYLRES